MRLSSLFSVLVVLCPSGLFATGTQVMGPVPKHVQVRVEMHVPLVATVDGPSQVVLAPGEFTRIRVDVLANIPWMLSIQSPNAWVSETPVLSGPPGGSTINRRDVEISCSPQARGPQTIALIYTLMPR